MEYGMECKSWERKRIFQQTYSQVNDCWVEYTTWMNGVEKLRTVICSHKPNKHKSRYISVLYANYSRIQI